MRVVRVATSGRRFRTYVGTMQGRRLPGGPRPIEQIVAVIAVLIATMIASTALPFPTPVVFGVGAAAAVAAAAALSLIRYDGVPILAKTVRAAALLIDRKPTIVASEEIARQAAANPSAFVVHTTATDTAPTPRPVRR